MTHSSESQDDMHRSTRDYVFWKINPGRGRQIGIGENKNEGDEFKGNLFLMKYKHYSTYSSAWTDHEGNMAYMLIYKVAILPTHTI